MLPCYVVIDIETTGSRAELDRITEIAAVRIENGTEVARWTSLINPGVSIPLFIEKLTGIDNSMVQNAPTFAEIAPDLLAILQGAVFVAHNARFDYGFIIKELERIGIRYQSKTFCTVRFSRLLYPQYKSHGLDAILQRHGLSTNARHRAMGDVEVVLAWLQVAKTELGMETLQQSAQKLLQGSASLPPHLETPLEDIPDSPGVYIMYGTSPLPLYIGKSIHMRRRVLSHFQAATQQSKEMRLLQDVRRIEWLPTAGELGALLLEARLVKQKQPVFNRQLRRENQLCSWLLHDDPSKHPILQLVRMDGMQELQPGTIYGVYRSKRHATEALRKICTQHGLCPQAVGLESGKGPCFAYQIKQCKGQCAGRETPALHRARLQIALADQRLQAWPYPGKVAIREYDSHRDRTDIHVFDQWCHLATVQNMAELNDVLQSRTRLAFDLDTYRLLSKRLGIAARNDSSVFLVEELNHA
jgi:DNA polymerase-3 subunit epsilon